MPLSLLPPLEPPLLPPLDPPLEPPLLPPLEPPLEPPLPPPELLLEPPPLLLLLPQPAPPVATATPRATKQNPVSQFLVIDDPSRAYCDPETLAHGSPGGRGAILSATRDDAAVALPTPMPMPMVPDPARLTTLQLVVSVLAVLGASAACTLLALGRRVSPRAGAGLLCVCAIAAMASWLRFGELHGIAVRPDGGRFDDARTVQHRPLQFHEFFHYYVGSKYFAELGYLGLYDCTALADQEIAASEGGRPRIDGFVRYLGDVLADKPAVTAGADCSAGPRLRFSAARWQAFEDDLRELQHLVPDAFWNDVVDDKGLNPPPTSVLLESAVANLVPIRFEGLPTYLVTTSIDMLLVALSFLALRRAFGASAAAAGAVVFGASFLASYGWLGGAVLRFTWVAALLISLACMRRERWVLAGALMGWAICDRVFPAGFAVGAAVPLVWRAPGSRAHRARLAHFVLGLGTVIVVAGVASVVVFGVADWRVFVSRTVRDAGVHNVLHIGLDKILTYRPGVSGQDFHGHEGLSRFRAWNERIDATWASERALAAVAQAAAMGAAIVASRRRAPFEAAVLVGVTAMFSLASPSSYYYVVLSVVPVLLLRSALHAHGAGRSRDLRVLLAFQAFWLVTLLAVPLLRDAIVADLVICVALAAFLGIWMVAWAGRAAGREHRPFTA